MSPKIITDEYTAIPSRQARYQARRRGAGLCISCGVGKLATKNHCLECKQRAGIANKVWREKQKEGNNDQPDSVQAY